MTLPNSDHLAAELCRIAHAAGAVIIYLLRTSPGTLAPAAACDFNLRPDT